MRALSLPVAIRLATVTVLAVVGLPGCGGGGGDDAPPPAARTGLLLQLIDFNCRWPIVEKMVINTSSYTVASTTTTVCIDGFIESNVPIAWSNSAGGSGEASLESVNCQCGPNSCCQLVWSVNILLQTGINTLAFTATAFNGASDTASLTITREP